MLAGQDGQAYHGVLIHPDQTAGLAHAAARLQMLQDREGFVLGEFGPIQRRALALGEPFLASAAGQHAALLVGAVAEADAQVVQATPAVVATLGGSGSRRFSGRPWLFLQIKASRKGCRFTQFTIERTNRLGKPDKTRPKRLPPP